MKDPKTGETVATCYFDDAANAAKFIERTVKCDFILTSMPEEEWAMHVGLSPGELTAISRQGKMET